MQEQPKKDTILEALQADVDALGGNKAVGMILWPEKDPVSAGKHLSNCFREDRNERITPEQVALIIKRARHAGSFHTLHHICDDASVTHPTPIEPEDERARLQKQFIKAVEHLDFIRANMDRLQ
ncbi:MAG: hypothetical protein Q8N34_03315 [Gammaproteobacteria bacterium]|nr:hypothetical protein [Gammaproteobacteria bacterium]